MWNYIVAAALQAASDAARLKSLGENLSGQNKRQGINEQYLSTMAGYVGQTKRESYENAAIMQRRGKREVNKSAALASAQAKAHAIRYGMAGTTVAPAMETGVQTQRAESMLDLQERIATMQNNASIAYAQQMMQVENRYYDTLDNIIQAKTAAKVAFWTGWSESMSKASAAFAGMGGGTSAGGGSPAQTPTTTTSQTPTYSNPDTYKPFEQGRSYGYSELNQQGGVAGYYGQGGGWQTPAQTAGSSYGSTRNF